MDHTHLQQDNGDDGHLRTQPGKEALQLPTLTNQVTVDNDGNQTHGLHRSLGRRDRDSESECSLLGLAAPLKP